MPKILSKRGAIKELLESGLNEDELAKYEPRRVVEPRGAVEQTDQEEPVSEASLSELSLAELNGLGKRYMEWDRDHSLAGSAITSLVLGGLTVGELKEWRDLNNDQKGKQ